MFTGIVQGLVPLLSIERESGLARFTLLLEGLSDGLELGASVAVNGTCLTVTRVEEHQVRFEVIAETLRMTNLGDLTEGDQVNVERSFRVGDEVGGHIVSGHVTGTAALLERRVEDHDHVLRFALDPTWANYVFFKGFIALDGASLTVSALNREQEFFEVSLIPETLARTTLGTLQEGARVNIEVDAQTVSTVDTIERVMNDPQYRNRWA